MPKRTHQVPVAICIATLSTALVMLPTAQSARQNAAPVTDTPAGWATYTDAARHFHFQHPESWKADLTNSEEDHYRTVFVAVSSMGREQTEQFNSLVTQRQIERRRARQTRVGTDSDITGFLPAGAVYLDVGWQEEGILLAPRFGPRPPVTDPVDLTSVMSQEVEHTSSDGQLLSRYMSFSKWGRSWTISVYLRSPVSAENREIVEQILKSFRFDGFPAGDELFAISEARRRLPPEAHPNEFEFGRDVWTRKDGSGLIVIFSMAGQQERVWEFRVTETGAVIAIGAAPDFLGVAAPIEPTSSCPRIIPRDMKNPFPPDTSEAGTIAGYELAGCWAGMLEGKKLVLDEYFSQDKSNGGVAVEYGGALVAHFATQGVSAVIRFTGEYACVEEGIAEVGAAYAYAAVNLRTGLLDGEEAASFCLGPDAERPGPQPTYVLGLQKQYPAGKDVWEGPDFAGTAARQEFKQSSVASSEENLRLFERWKGTLEGEEFILDLYDDSTGTHQEAVIHYGGAMVGRELVIGPVIRFTGEYVCFGGRNGGGHQAVNLLTGQFAEDDKGPEICSDYHAPFNDAFSPYVLGLKNKVPVRR